MSKNNKDLNKQESTKTNYFSRFFMIILSIIINYIVKPIYKFIITPIIYLLILFLMVIGLVGHVIGLGLKKLDIYKSTIKPIKSFLNEYKVLRITYKYYHVRKIKTAKALLFLFTIILEMIAITGRAISKFFMFLNRFIFKPIGIYKFIWLPFYKFVLTPIGHFFIKIDDKYKLTHEYRNYYENNKSTINETARGYFYLAPAMVVIFTFVIYPFISAFLMGFIQFTESPLAEFKFTYYDWSIGELIKQIFSFNPDFYDIITFHNFESVLTDPSFWKSIQNTALIVVISVPLSIIISLLIAIALNSIPYLKGLFQTVYFLPYVTSMVAVVTVWRWFLYKDPTGDSHGLVNIFLQQFGINAKDWLYGLDGGQYQLYGFIIYSTWAALAFKIVVFLTGLQNINKQYYQAAKVDGASRFRIFWKITVPQLSPIILFVSLTSMIGAFKVFTSIQAMFGNPGVKNSVLTMVYYVYRQLSLSKYDTSAAAAVLLFIFILMLTMVQLAYSRKRVHY